MELQTVAGNAKAIMKPGIILGLAGVGIVTLLPDRYTAEGVGIVLCLVGINQAACGSLLRYLAEHLQGSGKLG